MLVTALVGIVVNVAATWCVSRADRTSLNVEGAFQHILNDLYAFIATAIAGLVVLTTGFARADAIAALVVAGLMIKAGWALLRESGRIFLEAAPRGVDPDRIGADLAAVAGVAEVHDLHIWEITSGEPALSAHVLVRPDVDCHAARLAIEQVLRADRHHAHDAAGRPPGRRSERSTARTPTARCTGLALRRGSCAPSRRCTAGGAGRSSWWGR